MRLTTLFAITALFVSACSSSANKPVDKHVANHTKPDQTVQPNPAAKPGQAAARTPAFADRLTPDRFAQVAAPAEAKLMRWQFAPPRVIGYDYSQDVHVEDLNDKPKMAMRGTLAMKSRDGQTADLVLQDAKGTMSMKDGSSQTMDAPTLVIQGVKPDGTKQPAEASDAWYLQIVFPLPDKPLKVGEATEIRFTVPIRVGASTLQTGGTIRLTLTRYVKLGQHTGAQIDNVVSLDELNVPKEIEGNYEFSLHGRGFVVFDIDAGVVALAQTALSMHMVFESPAGDPSIPEEERKMTMHQEHFIEVARNPDKDGPPE